MPPWLPARYAALVRACWAAEAADRPTFAGILRELRDMLREALAAGAEAAARAAVVVSAAAAAEASSQQQEQEQQHPEQQQQQQQSSSSRDSGATSGWGAESAPPA